MLNSIVIHGRLTADPELKTTQSGVSVCKFTVAVDRSFAKQSEEKITDFFNVTAWRGLADMVAKYFAKGKEILVSGEMQSHRWTTDDGENRIGWEVMANTVDFCGSKSDNKNVDVESDAEEKPKKPKEKFAEISTDDDLPF